MVVAQPTWGVDVGAAMLIRQALIDLRDAGVALLVISEELDELFMICDRIAVIAQGRLSHAVPLAETNVAQIGQWMSGQFRRDRLARAASRPTRLFRPDMFRLEKRPEPSKVMRIASPLIAAVAMLATGLVVFSLLGQRPGAGVPGVLRQAGRQPLRPRRAAAEGVAADPVRPRPRALLSHQRLEHRRRGPAHARRDRRRRRRAVVRRQHEPARAARDARGRRARRRGLGRDPRVPAQPLPHERDPRQPDARVRRAAAAVVPRARAVARPGAATTSRSRRRSATRSCCRC